MLTLENILSSIRMMVHVLTSYKEYCMTVFQKLGREDMFDPKDVLRFIGVLNRAEDIYVSAIPVEYRDF